MTLIVNLFGAPGAGKSTTRAGVFHRLKLAGVNAEEVVEYAKDLTWEKRFNTLLCQPYVMGKQLKRMETLIGQVDVLITDSPLLLGYYYGKKYSDYPESFYQFIIDQSNKMGGMNYFIHRVKAYNPKGRNQSEEESGAVHNEIKNLLDSTGTKYHNIDGNEAAAEKIADAVLYVLLEAVRR